MRIRRITAYLGLLIGLALLVWSGFVRYPLQESTSINGYGIVREAARDGVGRDKQGRLARRDQTTKKDPNTCYT